MANVEFKNAVKRFGDLTVIQGIDLKLDSGEFIVFVGPSGCGKSTLLRMIAGLEELSDGEIHIGDKNMTDVVQSYALYPHMSVAENMGFGLRMNGVDKKVINDKVMEAAKTLQLHELLDRKPKNMSGGQRQRVAMGRALVREPSVFLFDEPLSNLDAKLRTDLRVELKRLHQRLGNTMIYVTHDQIEALTLADRIAIMKDGLIQQLDTPHGIYNNPTNRFVAGFIGSPGMNFISGVLENDNGQWVFIAPDVRIPLSGYTFRQPPEPGQSVEIGIRPEHILLGDGAASASTRLTVDTEIVEPMGADTVLWTSVAGNNLTIRTDSESSVKSGDKLTVGINSARASLFAKNGDRL